jgi:uncharacterized hydrophobic protein (TIGR00271 family)
MSILTYFRITTKNTGKNEAIARLVKAGAGDFDFYLFVLLGVGMATLGMLLDSATVVIGSMLIALVLYPILSLALSVVLVDSQLGMRSLRTICMAFVLGITIAAFATILLQPFGIEQGEQLIARTQPSLLYFLVACVSGFAAAYATIHRTLNELLPGVAISVALVPPLSAVGISFALLQYGWLFGALTLLILNIAGIAVASMVAFSLMDVHTVLTK